MVRPHRRRQAGDAERCEDQALVAEDGLAAEHGNDLGDDPEERQRDDVDLGMAEEPEQVLPENRPAVGGIEDVRAELPIRLQGEQRRREHGERDKHEDRRHQDVPGEDRHPEHRHARCAHAQDRRDEVDRAEDRAEAGQGKAHDPHVRAGSWTVYGVGERRVRVPAEIGPTTRCQGAAEHDERPEQEEPVAQHVEPWEGDVRRADLQRHDLVGETDEQGRREHQQHQRAVHREQLVVLLRRQELQAGTSELGSHELGHDAGDDEEHERRDQVEMADRLVVGRRDPAHETAAGAHGHPTRAQPLGGRLDERH